MNKLIKSNIKIAIIGGTGLLGSNLMQLYSKFDVRAFSRANSKNLEISKNTIINFDKSMTQLDNYFESWTPDIIINTVALVNLEACEKDLALANKVNCQFAKDISIIAKKYGAYFIHISTDHFFNDTKETHNEMDEIILLNNYATSKYNAENQVLNEYPHSLIVRTNIIGFRGNETKSFFEWLIEALKKSKDIKLYTNFFTSPISVNELGKILLECYTKKLFGIYNIGSTEVINKHEFGIKVAEKFNFSIKNIEKSKLTNISESKLNRALTLGLDVSKIENALEIKMPTINQTITSLNKEYKEKYEQ